MGVLLEHEHFGWPNARSNKLRQRFAIVKQDTQSLNIKKGIVSPPISFQIRQLHSVFDSSVTGISIMVVTLSISAISPIHSYFCHLSRQLWQLPYL
jgi:hypothetical protein